MVDHIPVLGAAAIFPLIALKTCLAARKRACEMYQLSLNALTLQLPENSSQQGGCIAVPAGAAVECYNLHEFLPLLIS
jgi:hypothetical protein